MMNLKKASKMGCTVVVIGDSKCGKTSLIRKFVTGEFQEQKYAPTSFDKSFATQEVEKHEVNFTFWDTSGSPAYDSIRSLSYQDADVFLVCFKVSDPISLYNVKNKWTSDIRTHRPDLPIVLCGCQTDLRQDGATLTHLGKTGRSPVSREQALAICCEIGAVHYTEISAKLNNSDHMSVTEPFELCALAAIKHKNKNQSNDNRGFQRSPSIHSSISLFEPSNLSSQFKRSPSTHSSLSLTSAFPCSKLGHHQRQLHHNSSKNSGRRHSQNLSNSVTSLRSPLENINEMKFLRTFSPEPRIPPVISEHETYHQPSHSEMSSPEQNCRNSAAASATFNPPDMTSRPVSLCEPFPSMNFPSHSEAPADRASKAEESSKLQRPTTLFSSNQFPTRNTTSFFSPTGSVVHSRSFFPPVKFPTDSLSEIGTPCGGVSTSPSNSLIKSPQYDIVWPNNAQVKPNYLARRISYRTHPKMAIPVATPMSPLATPLSPMGSVSSFNVQSESTPSFSSQDNSSHVSNSYLHSSNIPVFDLKPHNNNNSKIYASLKSSCSSSNGSSILLPSSEERSSHSSEVNSDLSETSSIAGKVIKMDTLPETLVTLKDNSEVLDNFVSPKTGVYRPSSTHNQKKLKHNCSIM